jgi:hypothetical protein
MTGATAEFVGEVNALFLPQKEYNPAHDDSISSLLWG